MIISVLLRGYYDPITCTCYLLHRKPQCEYRCVRKKKKIVGNHNTGALTSASWLICSAQATDSSRVIRAPLYLQIRTTTRGALESPCSPPTLPAAPLPSLIHPHQGPECLLSLSAPHYLLSFRVPCSPL